MVSLSKQTNKQKSEIFNFPLADKDSTGVGESYQQTSDYNNLMHTWSMINTNQLSLQQKETEKESCVEDT